MDDPLHAMPYVERNRQAMRLGAMCDGHFVQVCRELGLNPAVACTDPLSAIAIARAQIEAEA